MFSMKKTRGQRQRVFEQLRELFDRGGCMRVPNPARRKARGAEYKKGYELRFVGRTKSDLREIRRLLRKADVKVGAAYAKHSRIVQPVYGAQAVAMLCREMGIGGIG
jgi:hypothetical protein